MENLTGGTPPVRYLPGVVPCKLYFADIQETCVEICLSKHKKYNDNEARAMLYNITYEFAVEIMEMIDGYSEYSHDKHDIINTVTGEHLKECSCAVK